jgi:hypothetical protein
LSELTTETTPGVIAEFSDFGSLHEALRSCRTARSISFTTMDEIVGTSGNYYSKVLSLNGQRKLTLQSFCWALAGLGLRCLIVNDEEGLKRVEARLKPRNSAVVRSASHVNPSVALSSRVLALAGRKGGKRRWENVSPSERKKLARHAALARWNGHANGAAR